MNVQIELAAKSTVCAFASWELNMRKQGLEGSEMVSARFIVLERCAGRLFQSPVDFTQTTVAHLSLSSICSMEFLG